MYTETPSFGCIYIRVAVVAAVVVVVIIISDKVKGGGGSDRGNREQKRFLQGKVVEVVMEANKDNYNEQLQ